jgi:hypothetical protein
MFKGGAAILADSQNGDIIVLSLPTSLGFVSSFLYLASLINFLGLYPKES